MKTFLTGLLLVCVSLQSKAQLPDSLFPFYDCAHGHVCCQAHCPCCPELQRKQVYDTFVSPEVRGIKRYTIIERYSIAASNAVAPVQFVFKNKAGEITASFFGKWKYEYARDEWLTWKQQLRNDPQKGFKNGVAIVHDGTFDYRLIDETGTEQRIASQSSVPFGNKGLRKVSLIINNERVFGIADAQGNKRSPLKYRAIEPMVNGLARVSTADRMQYGMINENGREIIPCQYYWCGSEPGAICVVRNDSGETLYDSTGKRMLRMYYRDIGELNEGLMPVLRDGKWGFIDVKGNSVIPLRYDRATAFSEGRAAVMLNEKWGFIDHTGKEVIPLMYDDVSRFHSGRAVVCIGTDKNTDRWGVIDLKGNTIVNPVYDELTNFRDGFARAFILGKGYGFINKNGTEVIPCNYEVNLYRAEPTWFPGGKVLVRERYGAFMLMDKKGKEVLSLSDYRNVELIPAGITINNPVPLLVAENNDMKKGILDMQGKVIVPIKYTHLQLESDSILVGYDENKMVYLSLSGEILLPPQSDRPISHFEDGIIKLRNEKTYSEYFIGRNGKRVEELH